ncbi:hypothetical protein [Pyrococcus sp. ST04]|uniref:hypothetical protein n=1 Tax=Pyrococcus sp. ST04 TaxID=1183377 RepID=UPI0002605CE1|nr:hypothetical protein [Pyrococcus sp. ST04]AFK22419.1 hypothetical protein Py04_0827 [Pyrococcus sp. ST04]
MVMGIVRSLRKMLRAKKRRVIGVVKIEKVIRMKDREAILGRVEKGVVRVGAILGRGRVILIKKYREEIEFAMAGEDVFLVVEGTVGKLKGDKVEVIRPRSPIL